VVVAAGLVLATRDGGYASDDWYPAALFLLALLALVAAYAPPARAGRGGPAVLALGLYAAFCGWSYLSIAWAAVPADAWDAANRSLLYGIVMVIVGSHRWGRRETGALLALVALGLAALAIGTLVWGAGSPAGLFEGGRLAKPVGYVNATASLWLLGVWPALHLVCSRATRLPLRVAAAAAAAVLADMCLLAQSRGTVVAATVGLVVWTLLTPNRVRALGAAAGLAVLVAGGWSTIATVHASATRAELGSSLGQAAWVILASALAAAIAVALAAMASRRWPQLARRLDGIPQPGRRAAVGVAVVGLVAFVVATGNPVRWAGDTWRDFKTSGYTQVDRAGNRFEGSIGSSRYDFYRVALDEFVAHPVQGIGGDNFAVQYLQHRRNTEAGRYAHSFPLSLLSGLGLVGTLLFAAFAAFVLAAIRRARAAADPTVLAGAAAAAAAFAAWFSHGFVDWLWQFPALGVLAFALLAVAARTQPLEPPAPDPLDADVYRHEIEAAPRGRRLALGALAIAVAASLALPGIAADYTRSAYGAAASRPDAALAKLDRAAALNPASAEPLLARGVIAQRIGRTATARAAFVRAIAREPRNWFAQFELGLLDGALGRRAAAARELLTAHALNPRQLLVGDVMRAVRERRRIDVATVEGKLARQLSARLSATDPR
jgi:tetratricopeptide (TPR) repeat protein